MYKIDYRERIIFKREGNEINKVIIDKKTKEEILYKDDRTEKEYLIHSMYFDEEENLENIIKVLEEDLEDAKKLAKEKFEGIVDKAGKDYFEGHLTSVAENTTTIQGEIVAYLHDIVEDCDLKYEDILNIFGYQTALAVDYLTLKEDESYLKYVEDMRTNPLAVEVKKADLKNNMDLTRLKKIRREDEERVKKYEKAYRILEGEINEWPWFKA